MDTRVEATNHRKSGSNKRERKLLCLVWSPHGLPWIIPTRYEWSFVLHCIQRTYQDPAMIDTTLKLGPFGTSNRKMPVSKSSANTLRT